MGINLHLRASLLGVVMATALAGTAFAQEPQRGGVLTTIHFPEPAVLSSGVNSGFVAAYVSTKIYEGLLKYDRKGDPMPVLATSWDVAKDGLTITFHLRDGVKWHDGQDFTADDVKFSLEKVWKVLHSRGRLIFANVQQVDTPDKLTVVLHLSKPSPALMYSLNSFQAQVMPKHIFDDGSDIAKNPHINAPIGTGPWKFNEWQRGSHVVLDRNESYWDMGKPYPDRLVVRYIPDAAARSAALETGEAQLGAQSPIPLSDVKRLASLPDIKVTTEGYEYFANVSTTYFNTARKPFSDIRVRHAFAYATDRQAMLDDIWYGYGKLATGPIASYNTKFYTADVPQYPYDPEKAKALLDEAGYTPDKDGIRMRLTYDVNSPLGAEYVRLGELLKQQFAKIGVELTLRTQDLATFLKRIYTDYDYDFYTAYNGIYTYPILSQWWGKNIQKGVPFSNSTGYANPRVDELIEAAQIESDPAKQVEEFHEIQKIVMEDLPVLVNFELDPVTIYSTKVHDHSVTYDGPFGSFSDVWIER